MNIKRKIGSHKSLIESFFSLSILNGINVLLPLLTLPYILRVVGAANYGIYAYVYTIINYLLLITAYGFNLSATKQIAQNRDNKEQINIIYNATMACRIGLFIVALIFFVLLSPLLLETTDKKFLFYMGLGIVVGDILNPVWLYQGMEKMRFITIVNVVSKVVFTVLIFVLIKEAQHFRYITLINSSGFLLAGVVSTIIAKRQFGISFSLPRIQQIKIQLKEGLALFGTTIGTNLYTNANVFILNFFVDSSTLGMYAAAEKIIKGFQSLTSPITQALFPYISNKFKGQTIHDQIDQTQKILKNIFGIFIIPTILIFAGAAFLITIFCGDGYDISVVLLRIMSPVVIIGTLNYTLGVIGLVNLNEQKSFFQGVVFSGMVSVIFLSITASHWGVYSAALAMLLSELLLLIFCSVKFRKMKKNANGYKN